MDYRERWEDREEALLAALDAHSARTWCNGLGIVESVNFDEQTCSIQPAIMGRIEQQPSPGTPSGAPPRYTWVKLPLLVDCPIIFFRGGGFAITAPLQQGDEVMVFFNDKCMDAWWESGGIQQQSEIRFHDLSDGIALCGPSSKPNVIQNISTNSLQVRSLDGLMYIELAAGHIANIIAPGGINLNGVHIDTSGNVSIPGTTTGAQEGIFHGIKVSNHSHPQLADSAGDTEQNTLAPVNL